MKTVSILFLFHLCLALAGYRNACAQAAFPSDFSSRPDTADAHPGSTGGSDSVSTPVQVPTARISGSPGPEAGPRRFSFGIDIVHSLKAESLDPQLYNFTDFRLAADGKTVRVEYEMGYFFRTVDTEEAEGTVAGRMTRTTHFFRAGFGIYNRTETPFVTFYMGPKYQYQKAYSKSEDEVGDSHADMNYHNLVALAGLERRVAGTLGIAGEFQSIVGFGTGETEGFSKREVTSWTFNNAGSVVLRWYFL